jgi:hypothetical protein
MRTGRVGVFPVPRPGAGTADGQPRAADPDVVCWERPTPSRLASSRVDARGVSDYAARWAVRLPHPMNLDDFDLAFQPKLDARKVGDEATLAFVEAKANVALLGAPGRVAHDATMPGPTHQHRAHPAHTPAPCASLSPAVPLPCPWFSAAKPPGQRLPAGAPGQQAKGRGHADGQQRGDPGQRRCGSGGNTRRQPRNTLLPTSPTSPPRAPAATLRTLFAALDLSLICSRAR